MLLNLSHCVSNQGYRDFISSLSEEEEEEEEEEEQHSMLFLATGKRATLPPLK
jgi:hypothetical protein